MIAQSFFKPPGKDHVQPGKTAAPGRIFFCIDPFNDYCGL